MPIDCVFYKSSTSMNEVKECSVDLIITSPPYFNIKDYSKNGYQNATHSESKAGDLGALQDYKSYIKALLQVWQECFRILKPNGKLCINVPLMPMFKKDLNTHYNRHIFDLQSDIQHSILESTPFFLLDLYIWNRTNATKKLMFGSYPYPRNFYAQNTSEFISIYVKDGKRDHSIALITVAGNFLDMLNHVVEVGNDIEWKYKRVVTPSISFEGCAISGE